MEFYLNIDGNQRGPLGFAEFRELVKAKGVSQEDYVWEPKQGRWIKIKFHAELADIFNEEATLAAAEDEGFFINVEGKTGGPFPRDAIITEIRRGRFTDNHFVWDAVANRWLRASEHSVFSRFLAEGARPAAKKYYLSKEGARFGPFEFGGVEEKILAREFNRDHYVWETQLKKWVKLGEAADFADAFADLDAAAPEVPPPMASPEPSVPPAPAFEPAPLTAPPTPPAREPSAPPPAGVLPVGPARGRAEPPPPDKAAPEPKVGDLVSISIPPPTPERKTPPPQPPLEVSAGAAEPITAAAKKETPLAEEKGIEIDRSVLMDFSRPSYVRRIAAQLVDLFFIGLSYFPVAIIFSFTGKNPFLPGPDHDYYQQLFWLTIAGIGVFYFLVRDAGGASIGKRIMGLRVVKYDDYDRRAGLFHSIMRNITLLLPPVNILDVVYALTDLKGRRLGDRAAGTVLTESAEIDYIRGQGTILDEVY
ncbi:MAG: DUF4339 domain-containing protein [candidate division Zixibacteria bacterium]|nr:DUF4339 domain-containing protein [candidate division Zixibacteria bacterium]